MDNPRDKYAIYPDGLSFSSFMKVEPFSVLFWALGFVRTYMYCTATGDPARRPGIPQRVNCFTGRVLSGSGQLGSIDRRRVGPLPFPILLCFLSMHNPQK